MFSLYKRKHISVSGLREPEGLQAFVLRKNRKTIILRNINSFGFMFGATVILVITVVIVAFFSLQPVVGSAKNGWINVRNLTPVETVLAPASGRFDEVYISAGQQVQKGQLLGSIETQSLKKAYDVAEIDFGEKLVQLNCLVALKAGSTQFSLPVKAKLMVESFIKKTYVQKQIERCNQKLRFNLFEIQSQQERLSAMEDKVKLLTSTLDLRIALSDAPLDEISQLNADANVRELSKQYINKFVPMIALAEAEENLQKLRYDYIKSEWEKSESLTQLIETFQKEVETLDRHMQNLSKQIEQNFIHATISGTVLANSMPITGLKYLENSEVFSIQPTKNKYQLSTLVSPNDVNRFIVGTEAWVAFSGLNKKRRLKTKTVAVNRAMNGELEAILEVSGDPEKNTKVIFDAGYHGATEQRFPAIVTIGEETLLQSLISVMKVGA